jgi:hypothetical protein
MGILCPSLGSGVVEGIAATGIGLEHMLGADAVAEVDAMLVARPSAIAVILTLREESAEDAVLHMEHGHVLVESDLEPLRGGAAHERRQLVGVEVIGGSDALKSVLAHEPLRGEGVGNIEREITAAATSSKGPEVLVVAHEEAIGPTIQ